MPKIYSSDLARLTMWERIGNGIVSAQKKCGGDFEIFINLVVEYIKASPGRVAACPEFEFWLLTVLEQDKEWKTQFLQIVEKKHNLVLVYGRTLYKENIKEKKGVEYGE